MGFGLPANAEAGSKPRVTATTISRLQNLSALCVSSLLLKSFGCMVHLLRMDLKFLVSNCSQPASTRAFARYAARVPSARAGRVFLSNYKKRMDGGHSLFALACYGTSCHCWQLLLSQVHCWTFAPSAVLQALTSSTLPLLRFTKRNQGAVVVIFCHCWQLLLSQVHCWTLPPSAVLHAFTSKTRLLFWLAMR